MTDNKESRKQIILNEAARLFREKGYLATNLRELAKQSGIQGGSIYHHFSSKQDILFQLMDRTMNDMINGLEAVLSETNDSEEQLQTALKFHIDYTIFGANETYITDDELRNLTSVNYQQIISKRDDYQQLFKKIIIDGRQQKGWQVSDENLLARTVVLMGTGVYRWYKSDGLLSTEDIASQYVELICRGLTPRKAN